MKVLTPKMARSTTDLVDECLAAVIRGEEGVYPPALHDSGLIADRAIFHGVQCLLMSHPGFLSRLPADVSQRIRAEAFGFTSWEIQGRAVVQSLLRELAGQGIRSVLQKGTALAFSCYASPSEEVLRTKYYPELADRSVLYLHFLRYKDRLNLLRTERRQKHRPR